MSTPNILYIHSHDTGRYIQPYGHAIATPRLQQLAEEGVLFRQAFTVNPTCSASRSALVTGMCPHTNGMMGLAHRGWRLNDYRQHVIHTLKQKGYHSVLCGVQHVAAKAKAAETIGYDESFSTMREFPSNAAAAVQWLQNAPEKPFFMSVGFSHTHRKFPENCPEDDPRYCMPPPPLPDTPETRLDMAKFKTAARHLDRRIGMVLDALDRTGLAENTLVIATTDHGIAFPRMKCNLQDSGTGVMLILRGPGGCRGGKVVDAMVSHMDLFPTICELAGIDPPERLQGTSLLPLVNGEAERAHDDLFFEVNYHAAYEPQRAVRTDRWKYIRRFDERDKPVLPNCDDSPSKDVWLRHNWAEAPDRRAREMLFDLVYDPNETNNLIDHPEAQDVAKDLRARLDRWMRDTDDPLLADGFVCAPDGASVSDPDGLHPGDKLPPEEVRRRYGSQARS